MERIKKKLFSNMFSQISHKSADWYFSENLLYTVYVIKLKESFF